MLNVIGDVAAVVTFLSALGFCITYFFMAPWHRSEIGWLNMLGTAVTAIVFGWICVRLLEGATSSSPGGRAVIFGVVACIEAWRFSVLVRIQRRSRKAKKADKEAQE